MKKLILAILIFFSLCMVSHAQSDPVQRINFNGRIFELKYSEKSIQTNTYINEYYKIKEKYDNWSELIGVYYFPKSKSPIEYATAFKKQIVSSGRPAELLVNEKEGSAIISFMIIGGKLPMKMELNIFKYKKSPKGGTIALQYAHRYFLNDVKDVDAMNIDIEKNRAKWINELAGTPIPNLVERNIDLGK